ncbi:MAG: hypothetical protein K8W52_42605, partial [Deltaproteobacteria bacterium]|nr:hypothetical protein [Deltaproteobacteria bacterium]
MQRGSSWAVALMMFVSAVAHADRAVTLREAQTASLGAPGHLAEVAGADAAAADAQAAGAWPATTVSIGTTRATAKLVTAVSIPLPVSGALGAARAESAAMARAARAEVDGRALGRRRDATAAWLELARSEAM